MDKYVFPQQSVYTFFNQNFVNVSVQFDITKNDSPEIRKWQADAVALGKAYNIVSYPTYLFFNPQGQMVHVIRGKNDDADAFITDAKKALDPKTQYLVLKKQYESGKRGADFLRSLAQVSQTAGDPKFSPLAINIYLKTQKDLLTNEHLNMIIRNTNRTTEPGFNVMLNHPEKVDSLAHPGFSRNMVNTIIFNEMVLTEIKTNGKVINHGGGIIMYEGLDKRNVNWDLISDKLRPSYPGKVDELVLYSQLNHYQWIKDWPSLAKTVESYVSNYGGVMPSILWDRYANTCFLSCPDSTVLLTALQWAKRNVEVENLETKMHFLYTLSNLHYKIGNTEEAIKIGEVVVTHFGKDSRYNATLEKMKNGLKTWPED